MPKVDFQIGNQQYTLACDEGEQSRIHDLAQKLNTRFQAVESTFSGAGFQMVLAITALMMQDELDQYAKGAPNQSPTNPSHVDESAFRKQVDKEVQKILHHYADQLEMLAASDH